MQQVRIRRPPDYCAAISGIQEDVIMSKYDVVIGNKYGLWTVIGPLQGIKVLCRCVCGKEKQVVTYNLLSGKSTSCGCAIQGQVSHGLSDTEEYQIWKAMKARCHNPNHKNYPDYGGRGIAVCRRWKDSFPSFLEDMGKRPSPSHSIDRIDPNGDYEPGNCRWATQIEQTRNTRRSKTLTIDGETKTVAEWSEETGIPAFRIYKRLAAGRSGRDALFAPKNKKIA